MENTRDLQKRIDKIVKLKNCQAKNAKRNKGRID